MVTDPLSLLAKEETLCNDWKKQRMHLSARRTLCLSHQPNLGQRQPHYLHLCLCLSAVRVNTTQWSVRHVHLHAPIYLKISSLALVLNYVDILCVDYHIKNQHNLFFTSMIGFESHNINDYQKSNMIKWWIFILPAKTDWYDRAAEEQI